MPPSIHTYRAMNTPAAGRIMSSGEMKFSDLEVFAGPSDQLDQLIAWKSGSPAVLRHYRLNPVTKGAHMQRQFTMELRVDFGADEDKKKAIQQAFAQAARHVNATAQLISDNPNATQIVIYSDDFFNGHEVIGLLEDVIQDGLDATGETASGSDTISSELAAAMQSATDGN